MRLVGMVGWMDLVHKKTKKHTYSLTNQVPPLPIGYHARNITVCVLLESHGVQVINNWCW